MRLPIAAAAILITTTIAHADALKGLQRLQFIKSVADMIVSEKLCGLTYDQSAVGEFLAQNVPADDAKFTSDLSGHITVKKYGLDEITGTVKTIHCGQITRVAKSYGFIK